MKQYICFCHKIWNYLHFLAGQDNIDVGHNDEHEVPEIAADGLNVEPEVNDGPHDGNNDPPNHPPNGPNPNDGSANGFDGNHEAFDMDNVNVDAMDVSNEKTFLETKRKMILKKIHQDYKAQKSYEVGNACVDTY